MKQSVTALAVAFTLFSAIALAEEHEPPKEARVSAEACDDEASGEERQQRTGEREVIRRERLMEPAYLRR